MPRPASTYRRHVAVLMLIYIGLLALTWPQVHITTNLPLKVALALAPIVPMCAALWLIAMDVVHGDELQQRVNLIALSIATGIVSAGSFAAGVFCAAGIATFGGDDLMGVLPATSLIYTGARRWIGRRYGGLGCA